MQVEINGGITQEVEIKYIEPIKTFKFKNKKLYLNKNQKKEIKKFVLENSGETTLQLLEEIQHSKFGNWKIGIEYADNVLFIMQNIDIQLEDRKGNYRGGKFIYHFEPDEEKKLIYFKTGDIKGFMCRNKNKQKHKF